MNIILSGILAGLILFALLFSIRISRTTIDRLGKKRSVDPYRVKYISKTISIVLVFFYFILLATVLGIEYSQISFFLSSVFAVIGIALFAQWSILSNITASLIIFFSFPYRVGDYIQVMDKDGDVSAVIQEITLFHVLISGDGKLVTYPNSLILQKGVVKDLGGKHWTRMKKLEGWRKIGIRWALFLTRQPVTRISFAGLYGCHFGDSKARTYLRARDRPR